MKLVRSQNQQLFKVTFEQWKKTAIAQNFKPLDSMILGQTPRIICTDTITRTRKHIPFFYPLHKKWWIYFGAAVKREVNSEKIQDILSWLIKTDIYDFEINKREMNSNFDCIDYINSRKKFSNGINLYYIKDRYIEYYDCDEKLLAQSILSKDIVDSKTELGNAIFMPAFINIVDKVHNVNIIGFLNEKKADVYYYKASGNEKAASNLGVVLDFRTFVLQNIKSGFHDPTFILPSKEQYLSLCELYRVKPSEFDYAFLLGTQSVSRKCIYPFNLDLLEEFHTGNLNKDELTLISYFYDIPLDSLKDRRIKYFPVNEGRSILVINRDLHFHRYALRYTKKDTTYLKQYLHTDDK